MIMKFFKYFLNNYNDNNELRDRELNKEDVRFSKMDIRDEVNRINVHISINHTEIDTKGI